MDLQYGKSCSNKHKLNLSSTKIWEAILLLMLELSNAKLTSLANLFLGTTIVLM